MKKKHLTTNLNIRIEKPLKEKFITYAELTGQNQSIIVRGLIKGLIGDYQKADDNERTN